MTIGAYSSAVYGEAPKEFPAAARSPGANLGTSVLT
jgi:hypothetical protein